MSAKQALGRGLDALLGATGPETRRVLEVEVHRLHPNPRQPRKAFAAASLEELTNSILERGVLQPILVRPRNGEYEIIAGERRWRAAQRAGVLKVPVLVKEVGDEDLLELALVENLQREDLNPVEEAKAYRILSDDFGLTQERVAERVGKDRATVANMLRLLTLPVQALKALEAGAISVGHAKAILSRKGRKEREALLEAIVKEGLSVREAERYKPPSPTGTRTPKGEDPDTLEAAERLTALLGLPVRIKRRGPRGVVTVRFSTEDELQHLYEWLQRGAGRID